MDDSVRTWTLSFNKLWFNKLHDPINCLAVGKPFLEELSEENDILIGTTAGRVLILNQTKPVECLLETKGGSIQSIRLHDLTGFGTLDLAVGDCDGLVTLFSRQQILSKRNLGSAISHLVVFTDLVGGYEIIAGDRNGIVSSFNQYDALWRLNIAEESVKLAPLGMTARKSSSIRCMLSIVMKDKFGMDMACLLVCDGYSFVHFILNGERSFSFRTPCAIYALCSGAFLTAEGLHKLRMQNKKVKLSKLDSQQIILAGEDGNIYIMIEFEIYLWFSVGFCITNIVSFHPPGLDKDETDMLICSGHSNEVLIYHNGEIVYNIQTNDWPHSITMGDVNADGKDELVLGLLDHTIEVHAWTLNNT